MDGGPRTPFASGAFDDQRVLHYLTVEAGSLTPAPPLVEPTADLAPDQLAAVRHLSGPARIIAPAGSGKTRVLTERLRHLLFDRGYAPEQVTAVAYNKRAQEEMARRLPDCSGSVQTLNALGWEILREASPGITLLEESEVRRVFEKHCPPLDRRSNTDPLAPYLDALIITRQKLDDPAAVERKFEGIEGFARAFQSYREELIARNRADFDEQLFRACELLLVDGALRRRWQQRCRHLLVDEFQDLTPLRLLLIRILASPALDVFGVGDDDQVIYGYEGADPNFLIEFGGLFPGAASHALEVNYRCRPQIVQAAATLLSHNRNRVNKQIRAARETGDGRACLTVRSFRPDETASAISTIVRKRLDGGCAPNHIAVLSRVNAGLLTPQVALHEAGIPVNHSASDTLLQRTGVRSALTYLRLALQPDQMRTGDLDEASKRPARGLPTEIREGLRAESRWTMQGLRRLAQRHHGRGSGGLYKFIDDLRDISRAAAGGTTAEVLEAVRQAGLDKAMRKLDRHKLGDSHIDDLNALTALAALHPEPGTFEEWLKTALSQKPDRKGVMLAIVHRVKGEEWDHVIVIDVNKEVLPHRLADDIEEERRILHVAITRGRDEVLVLTDRARSSPFIPELSEPWTGQRPAKPSQPRRDRAGPKKQAEIAPAEGMALQATGGYEGRVVELHDGGVYVQTAAGGRLFVRYGEHVTVDGDVWVLRKP